MAGKSKIEWTETTWNPVTGCTKDDFAEKGGWEVEAVERAVARAYAALASGDLDAAESAVRETSGHPLAEHLKARVAKAKVEAAYTAAMDRARARMGLRNWKGAIKGLKEALAAKPDDADAKAMLHEVTRRDLRARGLVLDIDGGLSIELVPIPPGTFVMGGTEDTTRYTQGVEKPAHRVAITRGFLLGKYEVTRGQFAAFAKATGYKTVVERAGEVVEPSARGAGTHHEKGMSWLSPLHFAQDNSHPVVCISWDDAQEFCK